MDRDSKLIFENYHKKVILEADTTQENDDESWMTSWLGIPPEVVFPLKVLDPTGVLSYEDAYKAINNYSERRDVPSFVMMLLSIFCALPNFGLLAAGVGGAGWAAVKSGARAAVKAGPHAAMSFGEKLLAGISKTPGLAPKAVKAVDELVAQGIIKDKMAAAVLKETFKTGSLNGVITGLGKKGSLTAKYGAKNVENIMSKIPISGRMATKAGFDTSIKKGIYGKLAKTKLGTRALMNIGDSNLLPGKLYKPKSSASEQEQEQEPRTSPGKSREEVLDQLKKLRQRAGLE